MRNIKLTFILGILFIIMGCNMEKEQIAEIETQFGIIKVKLFNTTPTHRDNFIELATTGYYDRMMFHRVIDGFMIQGGDPDSKGAPSGVALGNGGPGYQLDAEIGALHFRGRLAAARKPDHINPQRQSSGSQFYIVQGRPFTDEELDQIEAGNNMNYTAEEREKYKTIGGAPFLDGGYTVFGEVIEGIEVVDQIAKERKDQLDRPISDVRMDVRMVK